MPAAKRSAPKESKVSDRATKASKKEAETVAPVSKELEHTKTEFQKECESILALLDEDGISIQDSAKDMLLVAAPFALEPPKAERHEFQDQTVNMLAKLFENVKVYNIEKVKGFEARAAEAATEESNLQQTLDDVQRKEADSKAIRDAADKAFEESTKALSDAKKFMEEANLQLDALKAEKEQCVAEKMQREEFVSDSWAKLKQSELKGAELRAKSKQLMSIVTSLDGEESLKLALPVALKSKPDQRGMIGLKAIDFTDKVLQESCKDMGAKIEDKESEIQRQHVVIAEKTSNIGTTHARVEETQNALIIAENELLSAKEQITNNKEALQQVEGTSKLVRDELHSAQEKLLKMSCLLERFDAIVKCGEQAIKSKEDVPVGEEMQVQTAEDSAPATVPDTVEEIPAEAA